MSFFGFDTALPSTLEGERRRLGQTTATAAAAATEHDRGEHPGLGSSYLPGGQAEDMGGELLESLDELNDETFGDSGSGTHVHGGSGSIDNNFDYAGNTMRATALLETEQRKHGFTSKPGMEDQAANASNYPGSFLAASNGSPFDLDEMLARDYQDLVQSSSKRPAYAALWDDPNPRVGNIWGTGTDEAQRQGELANAQVPAWGTPTMPAMGVPAEQPPYSASGGMAMNQLPPSQMHMHRPVSPAAAPRGAPPTKPLSLQDIEAELLRSAQTGSGNSSSSSNAAVAVNQMHATNTSMLLSMSSLMSSTQQQHVSTTAATRTTLSVTELEAAMKQSMVQPAAMQAATASMAMAPSAPNAEQMRIEQRNAIREAKLSAMAKYNGLMTQGDKEYVHKVQIAQLVHQDPSADDFYCRMYTAVRGRAAAAAPEIASRDRGTGRGRRETGIQRMQQQIQRIVNDAKKRPKATQVSLEGALGKIAVTSVRNPKQSLQIETPAKSADAKPSDSPASSSRASGVQNSPALHKNDRRKVLQMVEAIYEQVLALEELVRQQAQLPQNASSDNAEATDAIEQWHQAYSTHTAKLWTELCVTEPLGTNFPHSFISFLSMGKGKKVLPRVLRHCTPDQTLAILTVLFACMDQVDAVRLGVQATHGVATLSPHALEQIDLFHNHSIPPLLVFLSDTPMRIIIALLSLLIERVNITWVARSKARGRCMHACMHTGLAFLTMFLSRAEIICQNAGTLPSHLATPEEIRQWKELYMRLFSLLQGSFASLFPVSDADDAHVWQFLAAIAVGANIDQQHVLVTEVRERVLENVSTAMSGQLSTEQATVRIANVNLFLHALGLDASQVAPMR
ncbi:topoisomerase II-associated protein PAT1 [Syncephalis pseudoplumigaleata]|uniref:Topoisomerase II-associated protein PAT1 n=1 Tax=Syncephalis pseudoplumigaleata TaxID=1712513 RepID=A0A4P9Z0I3_9FUNG|nr:topoisomerase II-associated protein PAT1 [Syncephalis pseudoplumigaleata]|eukprot:RKP25967.1 topoisomerase II-associated protein PAT1 [Syncephalis pseudoplumigaleata]